MNIPENLKCVDLTDSPSMIMDHNYHAYMEDNGEMVREGIEGQISDANDGMDVNLTDSQLHRIVVDIQYDQKNNPNQVVSLEEMEDLGSSGFFTDLLNDAAELAEEIKGSIENAIVSTAKNAVTGNDGLLGGAAQDLVGRPDEIKSHLEAQTAKPVGLDL